MSARQPSSPESITVCAIVATHNRARFIGEAIDSLLGQTRPLDRILVIDDASTDETPDVLARYGDRIEVQHLPVNHGKAASLNLAIPSVDTDFVWLFDDDDVALPDALARHLAHLGTDDDWDFTYSNTYHSDHPDIWNTQHWRINEVANVPPDQFLIETLFSMHTLMQGMVIRREALDAIGHFDPAFDRCQDLDMLIRLAATYRGIKVAGEPTFVYREHAGSRGGQNAAHEAAERFRVSDAYRKEVFRKTRDNLPLDHYLQHIDNADVASDPAAVRPAALAQRGCLLIHQGLVKEGVADLDAALSHEVADQINRGWLASVLSTALDVEPWMFESRRRLVSELSRILDRHNELRSARDLVRGLYWSLRREIDNRRLTQAAIAGMTMADLVARCGLRGARSRLRDRRPPSG